MAKSQKNGKELTVAVAEVVNYLRVTGGFAPALQEVVERKLAAEAAARARVKVSDEELQRAADVFRHTNGLSKAQDTHAWLDAHGVPLEYLEEYLQTNLLVAKLKEHLEKKASASAKKYLSNPGVKEKIREIVYQEWLTEALS